MLFFIMLGIICYLSIAIFEIKNNPVVFTIDNVTYREKDLSPYVSFPTKYLNVSKNDALKGLYDQYRVIVAAKKSNFIPPNQFLESQKNLLNDKYSSYKNTQEYKDWLSVESSYEAIQALKQFNQKESGIDGYSFVFWFGKHMSEGLGGDKSSIDLSLAASDKAYCLDRANYYHEAIKSGKISLETALTQIKSDPNLGFGNPSTHFTNDPKIPSLQSQVAYSAIADSIENQKNKGLGAIINGYSNTTFNPSPNSSKNTYVYFIYLNEYNDLNAKYNKTLTSLNSRYGEIK